MVKRRLMLLSEEEARKVGWAAAQVEKFLREFNLKYPDPDAKEVAAEVHHLSLSYIPQMRAAVLAARRFMAKEEIREPDDSSPELHKKMTLLARSLKFKKWKIEHLKRRQKKKGSSTKAARKTIGPERESH
jgi:hypothetical protein